MKKLNAVCNGKDITLNVKDESLIIVGNGELTKIPYSDIERYEYNDETQELTIYTYDDKFLAFQVKKDKYLLEKLSSNSIKKGTSAKNNEKSIASPKVQVVKSVNSDKPNYAWVGAIVVFAIVIVGIFLLVNKSSFSNSKEDKYLSAQLEECSTYTLKEGLDEVKKLYARYNENFYYKLKEGKNRKGETKMYLYLYNLVDGDIYTVVELNDNGYVEIYDYAYYKDTNGLYGKTLGIVAALCGSGKMN